MKRISACVVTVGLALALCMPGSAGAVTYEDSFDQCNYPKGFDLMVMRPISLGTVAIGTLFFIPMLPLAFITVPDEIGTVYDGLVGAPARFTFNRALGECSGVDLSY